MKKTDGFKNPASYTAGTLIGKWVSLVEASQLDKLAFLWAAESISQHTE